MGLFCHLHTYIILESPSRLMCCLFNDLAMEVCLNLHHSCGHDYTIDSMQ